MSDLQTELGLALTLLLWAAFAAADATIATMRAVARTAEGPQRLGWLFEELHRHPRRLLLTLVLGREIAMTSVAVLAAVVGLTRGGVRGGLVAVVAAVVVLLVVRGSVVGILGRLAPEPGLVAPSLARLLRPLRGLAALGQRIGWRLTFVVLGEPPTGDNVFAREEPAALTLDTDELAGAERTLVARAVRFGEGSVRRVLTPRREIVGVSVDLPPDELLRVIRHSGRSRIPVYRGETDDVVGILYAKDLIGRTPTEGGLVPLLHAPYVVSVEKSIGELFREFRTRKVHIALVADEYGSLVGLVTMEDLLEELFGEIRDEHDEDEEPVVRRRGPDSFEVSGRISLATLNERLRLHIPPAGDEGTLAGMVVDRLGRVPEAGETLELDGCTVTVEELDGLAVIRLRVDRWASSSS